MKYRNLTALFATSVTLLGAMPIAFAASNQSTYGTTIEVDGQNLMTVHHIVAKDPSSGRPTSWVSAADVTTILKKVGIESHWIDGPNQLVLNLPSGVTVPDSIQAPFHAPKAGTFFISANSKTIMYPPMLKDKSSTYLPVYYLMQTLRKLGVSSIWTGSTWDIPAKIQGDSVASMSGDVSKTFSLTLANESNGAAKGLPAPTVPPKPPVTVQLPMNPLLQSTAQPIQYADENIPMEDYVQTGRATYVVNQPIAAVENWFKAAYTAQGFKLAGSGSMGNFKTGQNIQNQTYVPTKQQAGQQENVAMSYDAVNANQTKVEYFVTDVVVPSRPSSSEIAQDVTSMDVKVTTTNSGSKSPIVSTHTVTDAQKIRAVVDAVNQLTSIDPPGVVNGPAYSSTANATITFHYANGSTETVTASQMGAAYGDVMVDKIPFKDSHGAVWKAMMEAIL